jgi:hypothetical protein
MAGIARERRKNSPITLSAEGASGKAGGGACRGNWG